MIGIQVNKPVDAPIIPRQARYWREVATNVPHLAAALLLLGRAPLTSLARANLGSFAMTEAGSAKWARPYGRRASMPLRNYLIVSSLRAEWFTDVVFDSRSDWTWAAELFGVGKVPRVAKR